MKAKILIEDKLSKRWKVGEEGELLEHDFKKYDYLLRLTPLIGPFTICGVTIHKVAREFYFYEGEIEIIQEGTDESN